MLSRALISATVMLLIGGLAATPVRAQVQNLEAGKSPSQIFAGTCNACHKSPRGLLKTVPPGSLQGFLRQHYTTSSDMASLLAGFLIANGAADTRQVGTRPTEQPKDARPAAAATPDNSTASAVRYVLPRRPRSPSSPPRTVSRRPRLRSPRVPTAANRRPSRSSASAASPKSRRRTMPPRMWPRTSLQRTSLQRARLPKRKPRTTRQRMWARNRPARARPSPPRSTHRQRMSNRRRCGPIRFRRSRPRRHRRLRCLQPSPAAQWKRRHHRPCRPLRRLISRRWRLCPRP